MVLEMTPVQHIDSMGLHFLEDLVFTTRGKGVELLLSNPTKRVSVQGAMRTNGEMVGQAIKVMQPS